MRTKKDCTSRPTATPPESSTAFSPELLARIGALDRPASSRQAVLAGPWEAESTPDKPPRPAARHTAERRTAGCFGLEDPGIEATVECSSGVVTGIRSMPGSSTDADPGIQAMLGSSSDSHTDV